MNNKNLNKYSKINLDLKKLKVNLKFFNKNDKVYKNKLVTLENFLNQTLSSRQ